MKWYLPTFHGDIQLMAKGPKRTELRAFELTTDEEKAMADLRKRACRPSLGRSPWASEKDFTLLSNAVYRSKEGLTIELAAPIRDVHRVLAASLKPRRPILSVVRFSNGRLEEITDENIEEVTKVDEAPAASASEASALAATDATSTALEKPKKGPKVEKAAATVNKPTIGCPLPEFPEADIRASRVLEAFLSPEQYVDYRQHGAFIAHGADTGHRYMITNREAPHVVRRRFVSMRSLYDIDENQALCVHDWTVPPPEEMLALLFCVSLPGKERYIRMLPEARVVH